MRATVERSRIRGRLEDARRRRVTLIVASAGFGKTVLMTELAARDVSVRLLTVTDREASLAGFVRAFAATCAGVSQAAAANAVAKAAASDDGVAYLATWLGRRLRAFEGTIALDDFHRARDPEVDALLARLVAESMGTASLIVATREMPRLPIGSWTATGLMGLPIDDADLAFTLPEAAELAERVGADIAPRELARLFADVDGWPVALRLALDHWNVVRDVAALRLRTTDMVRRFADEQIFSRLSATDHRLLQLATIVPVIDAAIAAHAGIPQATAALESLADRLPLLRRDASGWRLHDVLRDLVASRTELADRRALTDCVARVYEERERYGEALDLYRGTLAIDSVERILTTHGFALIEHGERESVQRAVAVMPADHPVASAMAGALARGRGDQAVAERFYRRGLGVADPLLRGEVRVRLAIMAVNRGDGEEAAALLRDVAESEANPAVRAGYQAVLSGAFALLGRTEAMHAAIREATAASRDVPDLDRARVLQRVAFASFNVGDFDAAFRHASEAARIARAIEADVLSTSVLSVLCAVSHLRDGASDEGLAYARELTATADRAGDLAYRAYGLRIQYGLFSDLGDDDGMEQTEQQLAGMREHTAFNDDVPVRFAKAVHLAGIGRAPEAERTLNGPYSRALFPYERTYRDALLALVRLAHGDVAEAHAAARAVVFESDETGLNAQRMIALAKAYTAFVFRRCDNAARALRLVGDPYALGERDRLVIATLADFTLSEPSALSAASIARGLEHLAAHRLGGWARVLRRAFDAGTDVTGVLTDLERSVLRAFRDGASTADVARRLGRAEKTVSNHLSHIYQKLGCTNRSQALVLAIERGIIDA